MEKLIKQLEKYKKGLSADKKMLLNDAILDKLYTVYPFNKFEYTISHLIASNIISLDEYIEIRSEYLQRNKYLHLFELAPRTFGETWGQNSPLLSNQHRASQISSNGEIMEGQIHINNSNYQYFEKYRASARNIYDKIIAIGKRKS